MVGAGLSLLTVVAAKFWSGVITWFPLGFKVQSGLSLEFKHTFAASFIHLIRLHNSRERIIG